MVGRPGCACALGPARVCGRVGPLDRPDYSSAAGENGKAAMGAGKQNTLQHPHRAVGLGRMEADSPIDRICETAPGGCRAYQQVGFHPGASRRRLRGAR